VAQQDTRQAKTSRDEPSQEGGPTLIETHRLETPSESQQTTKTSAWGAGIEDIPLPGSMAQTHAYRETDQTTRYPSVEYRR
jgi:hypothetical protein